MTTRQNTILIAVAAVIVGFTIGAAWQYATVRSQAGQLTETRAALSMQQLEATLGAATIEAQRGSYEISRQLASAFFTGLQDVIGTGAAGGEDAYGELLTQRDAVITALSRGDSQSGSMLAQMFVRFRIAMGEPVGPGGVGEPVLPDTGAQ